MKKQAIILFGFTAASFVQASGFQILEQNTTYLGQAYSGTASGTDNASAAFYNPAATLHMEKGQHLSSSLALISPRAKYTVKESDTASNSTKGTSDTGAKQDTNSTPASGVVKSIFPIPGFMYANKTSNNLAFNFAMVAPFGLSMKYPEDSRLRYFGVTSKLESVALLPSVSYGNESLSVAFGPMLAKAQIALSQVMNIDGTFDDPANDHLFTQAANAYMLGWHCGIHYDSPRVKLGASFKSSLDLDAKGEVETTLPTGTRYTDISANSPSYYTLSAEFKLTEKLSVLTDYAKTRWSRFDVLKVKLRKNFNSSSFSTADVNEMFKDTRRVAVGVNYSLSNQRLIRAGFAADQTPTTNSHRNVRIPDASRKWYSAGMTQTTEHGSIDIGYSFVKMKDTSVDEVDTNFGHWVEVDYKSHVHILGIQWNYNWS